VVVVNFKPNKILNDRQEMIQICCNS